MLKLVALFLLLLSSFFAYSQTIIKGKILSKNGTTVSFGVVTVENSLDSTILIHTISNTDGDYSLSFNSPLTELVIRIKAFNYQQQIKAIKNVSQTLNFHIEERVIELKEINVKQPPIVKRNDTLSYNLDAFSSAQDRTLGDVLKKIPGIDVSANGQIKYQGIAINKFYVEGKDLMAGSYGVITNSLPNLDVSTLEIFQNHQPIKLLKDKVYSPNAAINIKLKKAITTTGRGEIGTGGSPLLWQAKLTPMLFSKKYQALLNYKSNNIGEDIISEMNNLGVLEVTEGVTKENESGNWINVAQTTLPTISQKRYLFNRTHAASANLLFNLSKNIELNGNLSYLNDNISRYGSQVTEIKLYNQHSNTINSIFFNRESKVQLYNQKLKGQFILTQNTESNFLKNILILQSNRHTDYGTMQINKLPISQSLYSPDHLVQNSFSTIIPIGKDKNNSMNIQSFINYVVEKQDYVVSPVSSLDFDDIDIMQSIVLNQKVFSRKFNTINSVSSSFSFSNITLTPKFTVQLDKNKLITNLTDELGSSINSIDERYKNDLNYTSVISNGSIDLNYFGKKLKIRSIVPIKLNQIRADAPINNFERRLNKTTFEPSIIAEYKFTPNWKINTKGVIDNLFSSIENLYSGYIFNGLDLNSYGSDISRILRKSVNANLGYESVLSNTSINIGYGYSSKLSNMMFNRKIQGNGQQIIETLNIENPEDSKQYSLTLGKFFPGQKINVAMSYLLNQAKTNAYFNSVLLNSKNYGNAMSLKINYNQISWLNADYYVSFSENQIKNAFSNTNATNMLQKLQLYISPIKNHSLSLTADYSIYKFSGNNSKNKFFDAGYRFAWDKKKIDFDLMWTNILNARKSQQFYISDIQTNQTFFNIRPSQLLFSMKFNFR